MGEGYQLCCLFSQNLCSKRASYKFPKGNFRRYSETKFGQCQQSVYNQFDLLGAFQTKFHNNGKVFAWTCVEVMFYFQVRSYSYTDWTVGCSFSPIPILLLWDSNIFCSSLNKWMKIVGQYLRITEDGSNHSIKTSLVLVCHILE